MSSLRSAARSLPPPPPASTSSRRPRKLYAPHPEGPIVDLYASEEDPEEARRRDDLNRRFKLTTWLCGAPHQRYLQVFHLAAVRQAIADAGCPHRKPLLMVAWIALRRCPVCSRRIIPHGGMLRDRHGLVRLVRRQFCSDRCARQDLRDQLGDATQAQIAAHRLAFQARWTDADWMRARDADPLRELLAELSDTVPLDPALLSL